MQIVDLSGQTLRCDSSTHRLKNSYPVAKIEYTDRPTIGLNTF